MSEQCEYFGKTSEELDAIVGMTWMLENCSFCPIWKECVQAESLASDSKRTDVVELIKEPRNAEADKDLEIVTNGKPLTYCNPLHRPALDAQKLRLNLQIESSQEKHRRRTI